MMQHIQRSEARVYLSDFSMSKYLPKEEGVDGVEGFRGSRGALFWIPSAISAILRKGEEAKAEPKEME
jgi:hypothetical protein